MTQFPTALKKRGYLSASVTINNWVSANSGNNSVEIPLLLAGIIFQWRSENNGSIIGDFAGPIKHTSKTIIIGGWAKTEVIQRFYTCETKKLNGVQRVCVKHTNPKQVDTSTR